MIHHTSILLRLTAWCKFCCAVLLALCLLLSASPVPQATPTSTPEPGASLAAAEPVQASAGQPAEGLLPRSVTLSFMGDLMAHDVNFKMADYNRIYDSLRPILQADDLSFANFETVIVANRPMETYPTFNVHEPYLEAAIRGGIEIFSLANNHSLDQGRAGIEGTLEVFGRRGRADGIAFAGTGVEPARWNLSVTERRGVKVGFMAASEFSNTYRHSELLNLVNYHKQSERAAFLLRVAEWAKQCDVLVISFHADAEYQSAPDPRKTAFFRQILDAGASIVWGHHPHVLQPWEEYRTADGRNTVLIHSAGNLISGQMWGRSPQPQPRGWERTGESAVYQVTVSVQPGLLGMPSRAMVSEAKAEALFNYQKPGVGMIVLRSQDALSDAVAPAWRNFFKTRLAVIQPSMLEPKRTVAAQPSAAPARPTPAPAAVQE